MKTFASIIVACFILVGCVSNSQLLMNNEGKVWRCASHGHGYIGVPMAEQIIVKCIEDQKQMGFVEIEKVGAVGVMTREDNSILKIQKGSPADLVGMKVDDKIIAVNGQTVNNAKERQVLAFGLVGEPLEFKVIRDNQEMTFKMIRTQITELFSTK